MALPTLFAQPVNSASKAARIIFEVLNLFADIAGMVNKNGLWLVTQAIESMRTGK
jgi:hypothetical protein